MGSSAQVNDKELVERFKAGDDSAYDILVQKYSNKAYQIAYGILGNKEDAEEVAQDAFIRIYRALPKFRGDSEFTTWMYRIVVNLSRNKYRWNRSRGAKVNFSLDNPIDGDDGSQMKIELPEPRMSPDEENSFSEFKNELMEKLYEIPPVYREALVLRNVDEMSYEDIASSLGCKLGTVKSRIARAREELKRRMGL